MKGFPDIHTKIGPTFHKGLQHLVTLNTVYLEWTGAEVKVR